MATNVSKLPQNPPSRKQKLALALQVVLRVVLIPTTLAAAWLILTSAERTLVYGVPFEARYSYSSAFKYFGWANVSACALAVVSVAFCLISGRRGFTSSHYFFLFLHDLTMVCVELSATSAATAVGFVGKFGIEKAGWLPICGEVGKFCNRVISSVVLAYLSFLLWLVLVIVSAVNVKSTRIPAGLN